VSKVIDDNVHYQIHLVRVAGSDEVLEVLFSAEIRVECVDVFRPIALKGKRLEAYC
jgi:hypothetical protein